VSTALTEEAFSECLKTSIYESTPMEDATTNLEGDKDDIRCSICQVLFCSLVFLRSSSLFFFLFFLIRFLALFYFWFLLSSICLSLIWNFKSHFKRKVQSINMVTLCGSKLC